MKRIALLLLLIATPAFADSSTRIKELETEFQKLTDTRQQYVTEIQKIEVRMIEIQGVVKELTPKEEKKVETPKK